ncbi:MAG: glycosyltransferase [Bacteroidales bacterium]|nr:glycosyltransferase [Bacteroidales bacterium]
MQSNLSIRIPIYNQPQKLEKCLHSISEQTIQPSEIILFDDCSTANYSPLLRKFTHLPIIYLKNNQNLGAVPNMLNSLYYPCKYKYVLIFHEDDIMFKKFIEYSTKLLDQYQEAIFCCSNISFFKDNRKVKDFINTPLDIYILDKQEYIKKILAGKTIGFGTIIYRVSKLKKIEFEFDKYSVLGDRPFLANLISENSIIYIDNVLSTVYNHTDKDDRWHNINERHVYNLHIYYKRQLADLIDYKDIAGFTFSIINTYNLIPLSNRRSKFLFYIKAWFANIFSIKYYLLSFRLIRKIIEFLKFKLCI